MNKFFPLFLFFVSWSASVAGQSKVSGMVVAADGEPLAFVSILVGAEPPIVVFSDIEGRFSVETPGPIRQLTFRYVGFKERVIPVSEFQKDMRVVLSSSDLTLGTVDIVAGENPADILIRKAVGQRHRNNPERKGAYTCKTYNKITMEGLPNRKALDQMKEKEREKKLKIIEEVERDMQQRMMFLMESVTERQFLAPNLLQEKVLHNRVSGFKNAELVALANAIQPFSFYGDFLPVLDKKFVNPISPGSTKLYFFHIEDTLFSQKDTIWVVSFKPRKGKVFMALKGVLHINSNLFAIQHVRARPAFGTENLDMAIEQAYTYVPPSDAASNEGQWFPQQLNFEIIAGRYPSPEMGLRMAGHSFITEANPYASLRPRDFNPEQQLVMDAGASTRDPATWEPWRAETPLNEREQQTYTWLDSIGEAERFDVFAKAVGALSTGIWPLKQPFGLRIGNLIRLNEFEGVRLGLGFTNAQSRPLGLERRIEWGVGGGYGFRDRQFKYDAYGLWRLHRGWKTQLRVSHRREVLEPGASNELHPVALVNRTIYAQRMDLTDEWSAQLSSRVGSFTEVALNARSQDLQPSGYAYAYVGEEVGADPIRRFRMEEMTGFVRFAWGEQVRNFLGNSSTVQRTPVIEMAWTEGRWSEGPYRRQLIAAYQSVFVRRFGYLQWRVEAGRAEGAAPMAKLFTLNQFSQNYGNFAIAQTFQALPDTLFLHDRFVNVFLLQEIGPVGIQKKYTAPFLSIAHNMSIGDLREPERHSEAGFAVMRRPYFESGIRLDNLVRLDYANLGWLGVGGAVYYRWGEWSEPDWRQNFTFRLALKFTL